MSHNQVENLFLGEAIRELRPQYERVYGPHLGPFYLGRGGLKFMLIGQGPNAGKLTIATSVDGHYVPDPNIVPVSCYDRIYPDESISAAVTRVLSERNKFS